MSILKVKLGVVQSAKGILKSLSIFFIVTFILGELTFQLLKPSIPYQYAPQKVIENFWEESPVVESTLKKSHKSRFLRSGASFDSIVQTNSLGWRDDEPDSRNKILVMGDSFTFGWGVNNNETIPSNLQEIYHNEYDFINLGFTAGTSPDSYATYLRFHKELQNIPTILVLYSNDWQDIKRNICVHENGSISKSPTPSCNKIVGTETVIKNGARFFGTKPIIISKFPISVIHWLKQSYMIASIRTIVSLLLNTRIKEIQARESAENLTEDDKGRMHALLNEIFHLTGKSLIIVSLDSVDETRKQNNSFYGVVEKYCDFNNEIHCLSISPLDKTKVFENDLHYNYLGTEYVANIIQDFMEDINFLKSNNL